jgi:RsiW-degrading membrane proteinase PrsW (M82 family)
VPYLAASAVVPSLLLIWYFRSRDVNPEPGRVVWATFFLGVLTVIPVLIVDQPIVAALSDASDAMQKGFGEAFFVAAMPEEFFKFLVITLYASRHKEFDEPMDGIVYGAIASLGFATLENVLYVSQGGLSVAILRAITAVPGHAFMGAIAGYYVGQAKFDRSRRWRLLLQGYITAVILHGLYDAGLLTARAMAQMPSGANDGAAAAGLVILTFAVFVFEWVWTVRLVGRLRRQQFAVQSTGVIASMNTLATAPPGFAPTAAPGFAPYGASSGAYVDPSAPTAYGSGVPSTAQQPYGATASPQAWGPPPAAAASPQYGAPYAAGYGAPHAGYAMPAQSFPAPAAGGAGAWLKLVTGGLLGTVGGLITLGVVIGAASGTADTSDLGALVVGTAIIGVLPLALGLWLFSRGVKGLGAPMAPVPAMAPAAGYAPGATANRSY